MNTPICDFIRDYAAQDTLRLHMPGHKGRTLLGPEALDLTEIPGADVLYHAGGIIARSEANAASLFGSARTLYSTEGSSLCIRAMLFLARMYALMRGRRPCIAAGRNAHSVFLSAAALLDLDVVWLFPEGEEGLLSCRPTPQSLEKILQSEKPAAVYLTNPDYLGNCLDVSALAEVCRAYDTLLLVDNAHGAYLKFLPSSLHPLDQGADLCCDSAHKTLPVLTGGAYLHCSARCPADLREMAEQAMRLFASTSPSYLILQSLDYVNRELAGSFPQRLAETAVRLESLKRSLAAQGWEMTGSEPLKLTLCPKARGYTGTQLAARLAEQGIVAEFSDPDYIVFMLTPSLTERDFQRLRKALEELPARPPIRQKPPALSRPRPLLRPREALLAPFEELPAADCLGRVLAAPNVSCPPAVPILVGGEKIDADALALFAYYGVMRCNVIREDALPSAVQPQ